MIKTGFKVVRMAGKDEKLEKVYMSMVSSESREVVYSIGQWAFPLLGNGPLTVFKSRKAARLAQKLMNFNMVPRFKVRRCLYEPSRQTTVYYFETLYGRKVSRTVAELENVNVGFLLHGHTQLAERVLIF
jgi:hypothetical protein